MKINTNTWNKIRYTLLSPIYDLIGNSFNKYRQISISQLNIQKNDKVLLIGAGTGIDLAFINKEADITATDITPSMVHRMEKRVNKLGLKNVKMLIMDGQQLQFEDATFDKIILHLILAVIPDPAACIKEVERVLKPEGVVVVYDKFAPEDRKVSWVRKFFNLFTNIIATDITRKFGNILSCTNLKLINTITNGFNGFFKIYVLKKP